MIMMTVSCNEPETVVTNVVYPDGSVRREIEMRSIQEKKEDRFRSSDIQVPFDSTWTITDSYEVDGDGDTTWIRIAIKLFKNVAGINSGYKTDSGANKAVTREVTFRKRFKWFNNFYRYSEKIEPTIDQGYPVSDFLNSEELFYYYAPESLKYEKNNGPDSLKYRALSDTIDKKIDRWSTTCLADIWIDEFSNLVEGKDSGAEAVDTLKAHKSELFDMVQFEDEQIDSLWENGIILNRLIGIDNSKRFSADADSAIEKAVEHLFIDFSEYSVRIAMPGTVMGTNGYIDSSKALIWPVKSDFFLTEPYEMWAESKIPNRWAWIVSGLFLAFVTTGLIIRVKKRG